MNRNRKHITLAENIASVASVLRVVQGGVLSQVVMGVSQPPKNSVVIRADAVTMLEYSAMYTMENFISLYPVWLPAMSSPSASDRSNCWRLVFANAATIKMKNASESGNTFHVNNDCACLAITSVRVTFPASSSTATVLMPRAIS